ncbi:hypothetical protein ABW19_dt0204862 [Dactylella cylindrospora]|nr:hypothetical protein ABW19_dt0204862 [Dactylella cylindrospora]
MASHGSLKRPPPQEPIPGSPTKRARGIDPPSSTNNATAATKSPAMLALEQKKKMLEEARARAAAVAASLGSRPTGGPTAASLPKPSQPLPASDSAKRLADIKARIAAAVNGASSASTLPRASSPPLSSGPRDQQDPVQDAGKGRGGLDIGIHPALLSDSVDATSSVSRGRQAMKPKFATTMANQKVDSTPKGATSQIYKPSRPADAGRNNLDTTAAKNPYFDPSISGPGGSHQKSRMSKGLVFNQKGKFIEQANALRKQAQLEELKKRIAAAARRAGIEEEMDTDKLFLRDPPPDVEWWDQGLCSNMSYEDIDSDSLKINSEDSIITVYVQHPILLEPPMDKQVPAAKPLPLTKKEQKKTRLQNRMAKLKETQAKIRLGLEPAPPPKVTMKNMMRVWGDEAVKDPTAVEAKVNRQIAERREQHMTANEERKLTKEQRLEKLHTNQEKDLAKGVHCLVFRIENLTNPSHQFKIWKNAEQLSLTGICIHNPKFNLVIVEGGQWAINKYKKLMTQRIKWNEAGAGANSDIEEDDPAPGTVSTSSVTNACILVWEGELKNKAFKKFTTNRCETEGEVRKLLERNRVENYWTLAKAKGTS